MLVSAHGRPCSSTDSVADGGPRQPISRPYCSAGSIADPVDGQSCRSAGAVADAFAGRDPRQPVGRPECSAGAVADPFADRGPRQPVGRPYCSAGSVADNIADNRAWESDRGAFQAVRGSNFEPDTSPEPCARPADGIPYRGPHAPSDDSYSDP